MSFTPEFQKVLIEKLEQTKREIEDQEKKDKLKDLMNRDSVHLSRLLAEGDSELAVLLSPGEREEE